MPAPATAVSANEAELAARWGAGLRGSLRLEDGRLLKVVFPGVPGGASGPDYRGAIVDAGGDLLRGDVEIHLRASSWRAHRHHLDPAYADVALHVVEVNDTGATATLHASCRPIAILVAPAPCGWGGYPPPFTPPCALVAARGLDPGPILDRLGLRRLRAKASRAALVVGEAGPGQALYALLLETLAGPANRAAFGSIARRLPLAALLERADTARPGTSRATAVTAELKGVAAQLVLQRAGLRPMAAPARRLEAAANLVGRLWPAASGPGWPAALGPGAGIVKLLLAPGVGRCAAIEMAANAVLPVAFAAGAWPGAAVEEAWRSLPSPGTYGKLRRLEGWLGAGGTSPFGAAGRLQGGLLLHADYCTKGECGRCPVEG
jgi:hypothetical protein